jgi:hypothetical protein
MKLTMPDSNALHHFGGAWAKLEIFLGLVGTGTGLFLGNWQVTRPSNEIEWGVVTAALVLFVLGGYLTLAGHRSHLYRSNLMLQAALVQEMQRLAK